MTLVEQIGKAGVVGAGGGGFPTHVKLGARAGIVIANGAECEPLLHKDAAVMEHWAAGLVRGVELAMEAVGATEGVVAIKAKKKKAVEAVTRAVQGRRVQVRLLGDYYPAGDEYDLVYTITGKLIPPQGIPLHVGAVVCNVETFLNVAAAAEGVPVTRKTVTLAGAVRHPVTVTVPIGTSYRELIAEAAGGFETDDPVYCLGGLMMGEAVSDLETPVTKTSTGVVVLPRLHPVVQRKLRPAESKAAVGKSACDQCRFCTECCPRFLLGYPVEPHQVMRTLAFTASRAAQWNPYAALCCACGLCTLHGCPEQLYPKEACDSAKAAMRQAGVKWSGPAEVKVHPMRDGRRTPIQALARRLGVLQYDRPAPWTEKSYEPRRVVLPLKQSAGAPNLPRVKAGDRVAAGEPVGTVPEKALGAVVHAPFAARVESVTDVAVVLTRLS